MKLTSQGSMEGHRDGAGCVPPLNTALQSLQQDRGVPGAQPSLQLPAVPSEASLGTGGIWGQWRAPGSLSCLGMGNLSPLALILELQRSPNWKSQFLQN